MARRRPVRRLSPLRASNPVAAKNASRPRPPKPAGWTTLSGRGAPHQRERGLQLMQLRDGVTKCPFCLAPMFGWQDLDLDEFPPRVIAARTGQPQVRRLSHASCNRSAGARLGNKMRKGKPRRTRYPSRAAQSDQDARRARW